MKDIVVGMGEALWDVLPEGEKTAERLPTLPITYPMKRCNVLKINDEELITVSRMFGYPGIDLQDKCWLLLGKYNLKMLILTCGINGSYVFTPGCVSFQPTPKVEVADTVGAGDSFTAAFFASILKGKSVADAHRKAVETSAYVCTHQGAMPILPPEITEHENEL